MADKVRVQIRIADREYPISSSLEEVDRLRLISTQIAKMAEGFEKNFAVKDKQDVLAMTAFHLALKLDLCKNNSDKDKLKLLLKLGEIDALFDEYFN
ncbi:MAG: cell division protein ZapA [Ichthyobacteriaceae bacterium]|nr:cell division protein ZapA [Ichthyobacteriaceae bacterium]